ncbi:hypothetical protein AAVH_10836 [Aphelenchoides avenae]|nr:hypothetical protein AAVH_10836 [Aphelenchus avenae]
MCQTLQSDATGVTLPRFGSFHIQSPVFEHRQVAPPDEYNVQASQPHSAKLEPVYQDISEPSSDFEAEDNGPDQNIETTVGFDDDAEDTQTKNFGAYAILRSKDNGTHRTRLLECVKVTAGHPTDESQECKTVLSLDSASDHTYFKQSLYEKSRR